MSDTQDYGYPLLAPPRLGARVKTVGGNRHTSAARADWQIWRKHFEEMAAAKRKVAGTREQERRVQETGFLMPPRNAPVKARAPAPVPKVKRTVVKHSARTKLAPLTRAPPIRPSTAYKKPVKRGIGALREIRKYQMSTNLMFKLKPFMLLVRDVTMREKGGEEVRFQTTALETIAWATESYLLSILQDAQSASVHGGRKSLLSRDIDLVTNAGMNVGRIFEHNDETGGLTVKGGQTVKRGAKPADDMLAWGLRRPSIRRLCRKAGVKMIGGVRRNNGRVEKDVYQRVRELALGFLEAIVKASIIHLQYFRLKTVTTTIIQYALKSKDLRLLNQKAVASAVATVERFAQDSAGVDKGDGSDSEFEMDESEEEDY